MLCLEKGNTQFYSTQTGVSTIENVKKTTQDPAIYCDFSLLKLLNEYGWLGSEGLCSTLLPTKYATNMKYISGCPSVLKTRQLKFMLQQQDCLIGQNRPFSRKQRAHLHAGEFLGQRQKERAPTVTAFGWQKWGVLLSHVSSTQPASGKDLPLSHMISLPDSRCMCPAENPGCRDQPFTILYRDMDVVSGRSVPADIFQMQATTRYPGAYYIFQIKSGNEGREFYMRVRGGLSGGHHLPQGVLVQPGVCFQKQARVQFGGWVWRQEGKADGSQGSTVLVPLTF